MIRFTDIVPAAEPKKAAPPREPKPVARPAAHLATDTPKPAKPPRKPRKSA